MFGVPVDIRYSAIFAALAYFVTGHTVKTAVRSLPQNVKKIKLHSGV